MQHRRRWIAACGLAVAMLGARAQAADPQGFFDVADCSALIGWACDADNYDATLELRFYADGPAGVGAFVGTAQAQAPRLDVAPVCGGRSQHGFGVPTTPLLKDGRSHSIYVYARNVGSGSDALLGWAPRTLSCPYQAPSTSLTHFGFVGANDNSTYLAETAPFSNAIPVNALSDTDYIVPQVNAVAAAGARSVVTLMPVLFCRTTQIVPDTGRPRYALWGHADCEGCQGGGCPSYTTRWNNFRANNESVLNSSKVAAFYIADEPTWNGISARHLQNATNLVADTFPTIPRATVEAFPKVGQLVVPARMSWVGFDLYGVLSPVSDATYLGLLQTLKARRTSPSQRVILIMDAFWQPTLHGLNGVQSEDMARVAHSYYDLARNDPDVVGVFGFVWPALGAPPELGARDLGPSARKTYELIGRSITGK